MTPKAAPAPETLPPAQPPRRGPRIRNGLLALVALLMLCSHLLRPWTQQPPVKLDGGDEPPPPMKVLQVYPPVRVGPEFSAQPAECSVVLMRHVFGWSYGKPYVGSYTPPTGCEWTHVLFNLTMESKGRQFDRLAAMFLGDVEVFRTSTAEPTWYGIEFGYVKDMTAYGALLRTEQKIIFDLGNLVDDTYTGAFNATLTATFYAPPPSASHARPATSIYPLSARNSAQDQPSHFRLPHDLARTHIALPRNTIRAAVSVSASGNAAEEFWYTGVPSAYTHTFGPAPPLPGHTPFREIQLLINGELAGVAWPFAVIFTGGINPGLWRPVVGIAAFDLPEYDIDITPFLPLILAAGAGPAVFELKVVSADQGGGIDADWLVSGRVFVWADADANWTTTGTVHSRSAPDAVVAVESVLRVDEGRGRNVSLSVETTVRRALSFSATIETSGGPVAAAWTQGLVYRNVNFLEEGGGVQVVGQWTNGSAAGGRGGAVAYSWPVEVNSSFVVDEARGNFTIRAAVRCGAREVGCGGMRGAVFGRWGEMETGQWGEALYVSGGYVKGRMDQGMRYVGEPENGEGVGSYGRWVLAEGGRVVVNHEIINGRDKWGVDKWGVVDKFGVDGMEDESQGEKEWEKEAWVYVGGGRSVRSILGRGPG